MKRVVLKLVQGWHGRELRLDEEPTWRLSDALKAAGFKPGEKVAIVPVNEAAEEPVAEAAGVPSGPNSPGCLYCKPPAQPHAFFCACNCHNAPGTPK